MDSNLKTCKKCGMAKPRSEFYAKKDSKDGLRQKCKPCMSAESKQWHESNLEKHAQLNKQWWQQHPEKVKSYRAARNETHAERDRATIQAWKVANRKLVAGYTAKRRAATKLATPAWANFEEMAMWQEVADVLSRSGVRFEVDHVVPIVSEFVCGLHWEGNMQILPRHVNIAKQNRYWPDMP